MKNINELIQKEKEKTKRHQTEYRQDNKESHVNKNTEHLNMNVYLINVKNINNNKKIYTMIE